MSETDTIIMTNSGKQNKGRILMIGGALAILAGMLIVDRNSEAYTARDEEDKRTMKKLRDALENGVSD